MHFRHSHKQFIGKVILYTLLLLFLGHSFAQDKEIELPFPIPKAFDATQNQQSRFDLGNPS